MLAQLYMQQKRADEARAEFEGMVKRDPTPSGPRTMVGVILESQGKRDEAKTMVRSHCRRGQRRAGRGQQPRLHLCRRGNQPRYGLAAGDRPPSRRCRTVRTWTTRSGGSTTRRICRRWPFAPFEESLKKRPDNAEVLYHLGLSYAKTGDKAKAREALERSLRVQPPAARQRRRQTLASIAP